MLIIRSACSLSGAGLMLPLGFGRPLLLVLYVRLAVTIALFQKKRRKR